nr:hypothetical protein CFP56_30215 [Quercus suber]
MDPTVMVELAYCDRALLYPSSVLFTVSIPIDPIARKMGPRLVLAFLWTQDISGKLCEYGSNKHIDRQLSDSLEEIWRSLHENRLSLVAVAEEASCSSYRCGRMIEYPYSSQIFQPKHTMNGIDMGALEMHRRLLRKTSSRLPWCTPVMKSLVERAFAAAMNDSGKTDGSWTKLRSFSMTTRIISLANVYMFFGQELSEDAVFVADALQYAHDVVFSAEAIRLTPAVFAS